MPRTVKSRLAKTLWVAWITEGDGSRGVAVYWERASPVTSINLTVLHLDNKNLRVSLCVLSHFSHVWLFAILWTVAHRAPLPMEFLRQDYLSGLPCPPPGDLLDPRIEPTSLMLQADSLPTDPPGKPPRVSLPEFKSCIPPHKLGNKPLIILFLSFLTFPMGTILASASQTAKRTMKHLK